MAEKAPTQAQTQAIDNKEITKKRATVKKGLFKAELNQLLMKELAEDGYRLLKQVFIECKNKF